LTRSTWVQGAIGVAAAQYLRLVWRTTRSVLEPPDIYERIDAELPVIIAMWHGQHFLMPFVKRPHDRAKVLVSRHRDGEINAIAAARLGVETIRGSGTHGTDFARKGGVYAFKEILAALDQGYTVAMTADVPKVARVAGLGIVKIAQASGRPIYPMAIATSRRIVLNNWDHTTVNLPLGRAGRVVGLPIRVPADADAATLELARKTVEESLNAITARAYELADGQNGGGVRG
jgi:lysophospholipid acyltransferase (LPLAT)-like uncharacterized protein